MYEILEEKLAALRPRLLSRGLLANYLIFKRLVNAAETDAELNRADAALSAALRNN